MKINRRFFSLSLFNFFKTSYKVLPQSFAKDEIPKKEYLKKILEYLNYKKEIKNKGNNANRLIINKNIVEINGWVFTEEEILDI